MFSDSRNVQKRTTKSDTSGHCLEFTASTLRRFWRRGATLLIRLSIQLDYSDAAFTLTLTRTGPMPAAELASFLVSKKNSVQGWVRTYLCSKRDACHLRTLRAIWGFIERLAIRRESPLFGALRFARFAIRTTLLSDLLGVSTSFLQHSV